MLRDSESLGLVRNNPEQADASIWKVEGKCNRFFQNLGV
jgi:hypothetical protein